jgi:type VI secretion system protein ImpL
VAEAGLVQTSPKAKRRRAMAMAAGFATIGLVSVLLLAAWTTSFFQNRALQGQLLAGAQNSAQEIRAGGFDLVEVRDSDPDLEAALSVLRGLRDLPRGYAARRAGGVPFLMGFGLHQHGLSQAAERAYLEALQRIMLPRMLLALERRLQDSTADPIAAYEPLKTYLMMGGQAPALDRKAVKAWAVADWAETAYPGADRSGVREELEKHLDALLEDEQFGAVWPERRAPLDGALINAARAGVQTLSLADRAYALLKANAAAAGKTDWAAGAVLSAGDARAFANGDAVLAQTVPYFFTKAGFQDAYQKGLQNVRGELERDLWVMGSDAEKESIRAQIQAVRPGVAGLYAREYVQEWEAVVASLAPADYFSDPSAFGAATGSPSPLKLVLLEVRKNTEFSAAQPGAADKARAAAMKKVQGNKIGKVVAGAAPQEETTGLDAGQQITMAFRQLHDFVGTGKGAAPVDEFIAKLRTAVTAKNAADRAGGGVAADAAQAALNQAMAELAAVAATAPPMVQSFAGQASQQGDRAQVTAAQGAVSGAYEQVVGPTCRSATEGRYPFVTASQNDAPIGDLLRVFGLNGQVDSFTQQRLRPLLDTTGPVWRWRSDDAVAASLDPTSAGEFQRATQLRDLLLSGAVVKVEAQGFGGAVTAAELSAGGTTHRFQAGQVGARNIQWTTGSLPEAKVVLFEGDKPAREFAFEGPWALFRLFDAAKKENAGPTTFKATFGEGAAYVVFRVVLPTEDNPFSRGGLWSFRCPPRL